MKATAYFFNSAREWANFINTDYASIAMGTPPLELFAESYNVTHTSDSIETEANNTGYLVGWQTEGNFGNSISGLDTADDLYITGSMPLWLASPSAEGEDNVCRVTNTGSIMGVNYAYGNAGLRPVVILKNGTQIEKRANGTYYIK